MERVSDRIYVATDYLGNNVGFIITQRGLVLIESPMLSYEARHWQEQIRKITDKPFIYLINTHHHFDHVIGNCHFDSVVIAHKNAPRGIGYLKNNLREEFEIFFPQDRDKWEPDLPNLKVVYPQITFSQDLFLHLGDITLELKFVGGHSASSLSIYIPSEKIVFTGDNINNGMHPFLGQARLNLWITYLKSLLEMEVTTIVPGHGPIGNKDIAQKFLDYLERFIEQVKTLKEAGYEPAKIAEKIDIIDFFPVEQKERATISQLIAEGVKTIYAQV
jgi:cyclase